MKLWRSKTVVDLMAPIFTGGGPTYNDDEYVALKEWEAIAEAARDALALMKDYEPCRDRVF